jgi:hypothetical protein
MTESGSMGVEWGVLVSLSSTKRAKAIEYAAFAMITQASLDYSSPSYPDVVRHTQKNLLYHADCAKVHESTPYVDPGKEVFQNLNG